ncbi:hypothetical protein BAE_11490 [Bacillus aerophilus]|nr:hypothetical protein BAE_11490 [Bacillus aerophilus]
MKKYGISLSYRKKLADICKLQRVDKPSHSLSVLRAGAHECDIRSAPVLVLPRLQRFSITLKRRQRAKINNILALCQQSEACRHCKLFDLSFSYFTLEQKGTMTSKGVNQALTENRDALLPRMS